MLIARMQNLELRFPGRAWFLSRLVFTASLPHELGDKGIQVRQIQIIISLSRTFWIPIYGGYNMTRFSLRTG